MNYYNENDHKMAQWLRNLIIARLIPPGHVDERSIVDVQAKDLEGFTQCHFFAGIGGWSFALRIAGWPANKPVWTGSCPCQPFSLQGERGGASDSRDLWPVFARLIAKQHPSTCFGEQVASAITFGWLDRLCDDMEAENYAIGAHVLPASCVGTHHARSRLWWVASCANASSIGSQRSGRDEEKPWSNEQFERLLSAVLRSAIPAGKNGGLSDGVPARVVRLRGYGNAIVPQVAAEFISAFMDLEGCL